MSGTVVRYPATNGVTPYSSYAAFPASASNGFLAQALDTNNIYAYNTGSATWVLIGGPGVALSIGTIDSQVASANGAVIAAGALVLQSASATRPGLVNNATQSFSGNKTFTGTVAASNLSGTNTGDQTITLTSEATGSGTGSFAVTLLNSAVIGKVLTGYTSGAGTVAATDTILEAIQKLNGNDATNANLTGPITSTGNATAVASQTGTGSTFVMSASPTLTGTLTAATVTASGAVTGSNLSGTNTGDQTITLTSEATGSGTGSFAVTLLNSAVIGKVLTGYSSGAGTVAATDTILQAIQKLNGNDATNANLTGPITSTGNATAVAAQTGTGSTFVMQASPTLTTPDIGTPSAGVLTSCTGLPISTGVSGLAANVATFLATPSSANLAAALTDETGSGAAVFATSPTLVTPALGTPSALVGTNISGTASGLTSGLATSLVGGSGGTIPYQSAAGVTAMLANGTAGQLLQSNGTTLAPSWVTAGAGTVTSVAMSVPSILSVSGSPITTSGTLAVTLATQTARTFLQGPQSGAAAAPTFTTLVAPTVQRFTSTGTQTGWVFTVTSANATVGATYTNNGNTYTVEGTISAGTILFASGTGATSGGTLTKSAGTGDATIAFSDKTATATYTPPSNPAPLALEVEVSAGGSGGGASGTSGSSTGGAGLPTYLGANLVQCTGGALTGWNTNIGPAGGSCTVAGSATTLRNYTGGQGTGGYYAGGTYEWGGVGGSNPLSGSGAGSSSSTGGNAVANSGAGGGGAGIGASAGNGGSGGSAGGYFLGYLPVASMPYAIGTGGTGATAGVNGAAGGNGAAGVIVIKEIYQ